MGIRDDLAAVFPNQGQRVVAPGPVPDRGVAHDSKPAQVGEISRLPHLHMYGVGGRIPPIRRGDGHSDLVVELTILRIELSTGRGLVFALKEAADRAVQGSGPIPCVSDGFKGEPRACLGGDGGQPSGTVSVVHGVVLGHGGVKGGIELHRPQRQGAQLSVGVVFLHQRERIVLGGDRVLRRNV